MPFEYEVEFSHFPGGVAPADWEEYVDRVDADPGITTASLVDQRWRFFDYGAGTESIALIFDVEPTAGEKTICDNLAAASPGATAVGVAEWLAGIDAEAYRGYWQDFSAVTSTGAGPVVRMNESATLIAGRYEITWTSEISGSGSTDFTGRFVFERGNAEEFIATRANSGSKQFGFDGRIQVVLTAGSKSLELEIQKDSGAGSAQLGKTTMAYRWVGAS